VARPVKPGNASRRLRVRTPGWRESLFDARPGKATAAVAQAWRDMVQRAFSASEFGVLDALADELISFPEALVELKSNGMTGLVAVAEKAKREAKLRAETGGFPAWFEEFLRIRPRSDRSSAEQHEAIVRQSGYFLDWLVKKHKVSGRADVTRAHWTREHLREYVSWYVDHHTAKALARLEKKWAKMDPPLADTEKQELLRKERGRKASTANKHVNAVGALSQWLIEKERVDHDPAPGVRITVKRESAHRETTQRGIPVEIVARLLEQARAFDQENLCAKPGERPDALWWEWLYRSGATTYTEGVRLRPVDIKTSEESEGTIPVWLHGSKKDARRRHVYPPAEFAYRVLARAAEMGYAPDSSRAIFTYTEDMGRWWWDRLITFIRQRDPSLGAELEGATPYDLRHSFAILHLEGGVDIYDVMKLMGHSSIETTAIYLRRREPDRAKIRAAATRLDTLTGRPAPTHPDPRAEAERLLAEVQQGGGSLLNLLTELIQQRRS